MGILGILGIIWIILFIGMWFVRSDENYAWEIEHISDLRKKQRDYFQAHKNKEMKGFIHLYRQRDYQSSITHNRDYLAVVKNDTDDPIKSWLETDDGKYYLDTYVDEEILSCSYPDKIAHEWRYLRRKEIKNKNNKKRLAEIEKEFELQCIDEGIPILSLE